MISGIVRYVVVGSISVLVAANVVFGAIDELALLDLALIFLGGAGAGAAVAGLLYRLGRIRRRRRERERERAADGSPDGMSEVAGSLP